MLAWGGRARHRKDGEPAGVWTATAAAVLSALLPGTGQLFAGRHRRAIPYLCFTILSLGVGVVALFAGRVTVLELVVQERWLDAAMVGVWLSLAVRVASAIDAYGCLRPIGFRPVRRSLAGAALLLAIVTLLSIPHLIVARDVSAQQDLVGNLFQDQDATPVVPDPLPTPTPSTAESSPSSTPTPSATPTITVAGPSPTLGRDGRFTVLLLGSDAGPSRSGARTDTMIVLSINPKTKSAVMIGVPRNLRKIPFPPGDMQERFPDGFNDLANAVYRFGTDNPTLFPHSKDTGARAIEEAVAQALGVEIDDWAMVDLDGVVGVVRALGGIDIDIPEHLADRVSPYKVGGPWISASLNPGQQHLTADEVYVYVRSRHADSDYQRMRRQRCVLEAMGDQLTGPKLITVFPGLAGALSHYVTTDIPKNRLPALVRMGATMSTSRVRTVLLTPPLVDPAAPDYGAIRAIVRNALAGHLPSTNAGASLATSCS